MCFITINVQDLLHSFIIKHNWTVHYATLTSNKTLTKSKLNLACRRGYSENREGTLLNSNIDRCDYKTASPSPNIVFSSPGRYADELLS